MVTTYGLGYLPAHGYDFDQLDRRHQTRFWELVSGHAHSPNAAANGLSALPGTARPSAAVRARSRFPASDDIPFPARIEPAQDAVRQAVAARPGGVVPVVHDWCQFASGTHAAERDRYRRSGANGTGYELGSAVVADGTDGRPLGPTELRRRTAAGTLSARPGDTADPPAHVDEWLDAMDQSRRRGPDADLVHVIDREADSAGHDRARPARGHRFAVRADLDRVVTHGGVERSPADGVGRLAGAFREVGAADGWPRVVAAGRGTGVRTVAETAVVVHRPARTRDADGKRIAVPGPPIALRPVVARAASEVGAVLAERLPLTNVPAAVADAATVGAWYARRWRIETDHERLKSAGMNADEWQQETGERFLRRLCAASMACVTVWHLQREDGPDAAKRRVILVRRSGRAMTRRVESTAPSLLAGREKRPAIDDLLRAEDLAQVLALARKLLPQLFDRRRKPPIEKL